MINFLSGHLENFGPFKDVKLDLSRPGLHHISGDNRDTSSASSNGSGKTLLMEGIFLWTLYGKLITGDAKGGIVRVGDESIGKKTRESRKARGVTTFEVDGAVYQVIRERTKSSGSLTILNGSDDISGKTASDTQQVIESILGIDYATFRNTVFFGQGDSNRFSDPNTSDPDRKRLMAEILGLDCVNDWSARAKDRLRAAEAQVDAAAMKAAKLEGAVESESIHLDRLRGGIKQLIASRDAAKAAIDNFTAETGYDPKEAARLKAEVERLERESDSAKERSEKASDKVTQLRQTIVGLNGTKRSEEMRMEELGRQINRFRSGKCPTCGTDASSGNMPVLIEELTSELEGVKRRIIGTTKQVNAETEKMNNAGAVAADAKAEVQRIASEKTEVRNRLTELTNADAQAEREFMSLQTKYDSLTNQISTNATTAKETKASLKDKKASLLSAKKEQKRASTEKKYWGFLVEAFGPQGISNMVVDSVIPILTERANEYLRVLSDGDITVSFDTQVKLKGGQTRDKFSVELDVEGAGNVRASGGQMRKVQVATSLALVDLLHRYKPTFMNVLVLDEILDGLDASGQSRVVDLLMQLRERVKSIYVISHSPAITDIFESVSVVRKKDGVSILRAPRE